MNWTPEQLEEWKRDRLAVLHRKPSTAQESKPALKLPKPAMNKTEARRAQWLGIMKAAHQIQDWRFQEITFRLAEDLRFTPDFDVLHNDGVWGFEDVKGRKKNGKYWSEEDAKIKIKIASRLWPSFRWVVVFEPERNGEWKEIEF